MDPAHMTSEQWPAPAKLNLFLHVTGQRDDGYHELQTVFQFLDLCDYLNFSLRDDGAIRCRGNVSQIEPGSDLTVQAARHLQQATGGRIGVNIEIAKHIPVGGGLGGGSSDAATTLVALNRLWGLGLSRQDLAEIGLGLGADVPVFVSGQAAWAEGAGERLTPLELPETWFLVVFPGCRVATAKVFQHPDLTRNTPPMTIRDFLNGAGHNDCEPIAASLFPEIATVLAWLRTHGTPRMSGTGACVFLPLQSREHGARIESLLPPAWKGFVVRGLNRSPLFLVPVGECS